MGKERRRRRPRCEKGRDLWAGEEFDIVFVDKKRFFLYLQVENMRNAQLLRKIFFVGNFGHRRWDSS